MSEWWTCHDLWPLMTFDLSKISKHHAANKTNVSYMHIHTFTTAAEKIAFFNKNPNFRINYGPWRLLTFVKDKQYIHFWKVHIPYYNCAKFQVSVVNSVWEKCNVKVLGLFPNDYCPLWPLTFARGNQTEHFWKALIANYHHAKFQDSVINSLWEKFNV